MIVRTTALTLLTLANASAYAGDHSNNASDEHAAHHYTADSKGHVVFGLDLLNYHSEDSSSDLELDIALLRGTLGYKYMFNSNISVLPEVFLGGGIQDDTLNVQGINFDTEIDSFYGFSVKAMYEFDEGLYGYFGPTYAKLDGSVSTDVGNGVSISSSSSDSSWGFIGGIGYNFNEKWGAEFTYSDYDDDTVAGVGLRFNLPH